MRGRLLVLADRHVALLLHATRCSWAPCSMARVGWAPMGRPCSSRWLGVGLGWSLLGRLGPWRHHHCGDLWHVGVLMLGMGHCGVRLVVGHLRNGTRALHAGRPTSL